MTSGDDGAGHEGPVLAALRAVMRPLARLAVARAAGFGALQRVLKEELVSAARDGAALEASPPSQSRVSLMTGVHRKDVREILAGDPPARRAIRASLAETVAARWLADPERAGPDGPRPLPRGGTVGFDALVASISTDMRPRAVLEEMLRLGLVTQQTGPATADADGTPVEDEAPFDASPRWRLVPDAGVPSDATRRLELLSDNLADHAATAVDNLLAPEGAPRALERAVFYDHLSIASIERLHTEAQRLSQDALVQLNALAAELQSVDHAAGDGRLRFRYGTYFHAAPQDAPADTPTDDGPASAGSGDDA